MMPPIFSISNFYIAVMIYISICESTSFGLEHTLEMHLILGHTLHLPLLEDKRLFFLLQHLNFRIEST